MPFFAPDVMFLSLLPLIVVMLLSVEFWWSSFCGPFWVGESYSSFSFLSFGAFSSEASNFYYFFGGGLSLYVLSFYRSNSRFSILGEGKGVCGFDGDGCLPVLGSWELVAQSWVGGR